MKPTITLFKPNGTIYAIMTLHVPHATMSNTIVSRHLLISKRFFANPNPNSLPQYFRRNHHRLTKTTSHPCASLPPKLVASFSSSPSRKPGGFVGWYLRLLQTHPIATKSVTTSLVFAAADVTSQIITLPSFSGSYDLIRTARMAIYGLLILGPSQHKWFNFVSKIIPKTDLLSTLKKILLGQVVFGPIINTVFFTYNGVVAGETGPEVIARLKRDLLPTLLGGALFWPGCDFVTFRYLPVHLQPLLNSSCAYVWTIYLSYMANRA